MLPKMQEIGKHKVSIIKVQAGGRGAKIVFSGVRTIKYNT